MEEHFSSYRLINESDWDNFLKQLLEDGTPAVSTNIVPAKEIFKIMRTQGCSSVVVENVYMDEDHRRCHARLHHLAQTAMSRYCKRLHFFSEPIDISDLKRLSASNMKHYMGMCVWRPINSFPVGRTIISPDMVLIPPPGKPWKPYLTCQADYLVNIAGNSLNLRGSPYMQQDHLVSACATAAIWMAQWYMASRYSDEFTAYCSPEITDAGLFNF